MKRKSQALVLYYHIAYTLPPPCFLLPGSIGGESLAVAQNTYAVNWFKGKELNLVFGLQLSMARLVRTRPAEREVIHKEPTIQNACHPRCEFMPQVHSLSPPLVSRAAQ